MRFLHKIISLILFLAICSTGHAGERIRFDFISPTGPVALPYLKNRGLITEFLDPGNTGLGKSLAYLLWGEALTAISDLPGAGVIVAHKPDDRSPVNMFRDDYHLAAIKVANYQMSPMALWGEVQEQAGRVFVNSYLTLLPQVYGGKLLMQLSMDKKPIDGFEAEIPRERFNFALVETSRTELFSRPLVAYKPETTLFAKPSETASSVGRVGKGTLLDSVGMSGAWFEVRKSDKSTAYVKSEDVDVPPRQVDVSSYGVKLRKRPRPSLLQYILKERDLNGVFKVINMRSQPEYGQWVQLDVGDMKGWVEMSQVKPRFSLPAVHFMSGLYRYRSQVYSEAYREFSQFINATGTHGTNTTLATAYQLMGASSLMGGTEKRGLELLSQAVSLTPYDPAAYNLRALATLGIDHNVNAALEDLIQALELDRLNKRARSLVRSINDIAYGKGPPHLKGVLSISPESRWKLNMICVAYGIEK